MIKFESYNNLFKVFSDKNFYLLYNGDYYDYILLNSIEDIKEISETDLAIPEAPVREQDFIKIFFSTFPNITQEELINLHDAVLESLNNLSENKIYKAYILYNEWKRNQNYEVNQIVRFENDLYKILNNHVSNIFPSQDTKNYRKIERPNNLIETWDQEKIPYKKGDRVKIGEYVYESLINDNIWSPISFPAGWELKGSQD